MRIVVTSQNFRSVTGHAGKTRRFLVFEGATPDDVVEVARLDLPREMAFHDHAGGPHPIDGADVLVTASAGAGFLKKLAARGIRVVTTVETDPRQAVIDVLAGRVQPAASGDDCDCGGHL
jgi:predicted Fe-Mo cluster-binding NifX family protein